jgi:tellurite resistance protein TehA-like permease
VNVRRVLEEGPRDLYPGYFALVMATGIISMACFLHGLSPVAQSFLLRNVAAAGILTLLTLVRLVRYCPRVMADLTSHTRAPGFFTLVAACCTLGSQFVVLEGDLASGVFLWCLGALLWALHMYAVFSAMMIREPKPDLGAGLDGGWLIAVVATQSVSDLGTQIAPHLPRQEEPILFISLAMFLLGATLYLLIIALIFYRLLFFRLEPAEFTPPYWINMGATAITTLAGAALILTASHWQFLEGILPFLKGLTLLFWVTGTWWIPILLVLGAWRHVSRRIPLHYAPEYWGLVFPLGMYSRCTFELAKATGLSFLSVISYAFVYISLLAWTIAFLGLVHGLLSSFAMSPVNWAKAS